MRVIGGVAKGHRLKAPRPQGRTRPVTSRVKEAIFSILETEASDWSKGLDLFAGTGALGIEALSRGAGWVDFVEEEPRVCNVIKQNLELTGLSNSSHVYCCSVSRALTFLKGKYGLVFMDPPYSSALLGVFMEKLGSSDILADSALLVALHSSHSSLDSQYSKLQVSKERRYGDTCLTIYRCHREGTS